MLISFIIFVHQSFIPSESRKIQLKMLHSLKIIRKFYFILIFPTYKSEQLNKENFYQQVKLEKIKFYENYRYMQNILRTDEVLDQTRWMNHCYVEREPRNCRKLK